MMKERYDAAPAATVLFLFTSLMLLSTFQIISAQDMSNNHLYPDYYDVCPDSSISSMQASEAYHFFGFVMQWQISACITMKCQKAEQTFNIHGLWPVHGNGTGVIGCTDFCGKFYRKQIRSLDEELEGGLSKEWPSVLIKKDNYAFWEHEWKKHGCCSESTFSLTEYFKTAYKLKQRYNILDYLRNKGIIPNDDHPYELNTISQAIENGISEATGNIVSDVVRISCRNTEKSAFPLLHEIILCVDKKGQNLKSCPTTHKCNSNSVIFPEQHVLKLSDSISDGYEFFDFVQRWQISACILRPCTKKANQTFSIHGLWPAYSNGTSVLSCSPQENFNQNKVENVDKELESGLSKEWPALEWENYALWEHEWKKHGSCSESHLGLSEYMTAAYEIKQRYNVLDYLRKQDIIPKNGVPYKVRSIVKAIENGIQQATGIEIKNAVQVHCANRTNSPNEEPPLLYQIFLCLDKTAKHLTACPRRNKCRSKSVVFPEDHY